MTKPLSSYERALEKAEQWAITSNEAIQQSPAKWVTQVSQALLQAEEMLKEAEYIAEAYRGSKWTLPGEWLQKRQKMLEK